MKPARRLIHRVWLALVAGLAGGPRVPAGEYRVEDIAFPPDVPPEVGALDFATDGTLYVALRRGDVLAARPAADPQGFAWRRFATGFENGNGLLAIEPGRVWVAQMAELTEATDSDGDGIAERYRVIADEWGLSGNYHETNALVRDGRGGYYLLLGTASHNGPVFEHVKGAYSRLGRRGRNFSAVEYRGWTLHLSPEGRLTPFASGFRMQNGGTVDDEGNLWSGDNQGDWKATTPLYHVRQGRFYGHPSSLVWDRSWPAGRDPLEYYRDHLDAYDAHRTPPAVQVPHGDVCRSAGEPLQIPRRAEFGPFGGQMLLPDNNGPRIARVMLERVQGEFQGAVTLFLQDDGLRSGNHRLRFSPDGRALYVGQTVRGWGRPTEGLQRITWSGVVPFAVEWVRITPSGFRVRFTQPVNSPKGDALAVRSMIYRPRWTYGSDPEEVREEPVTRITAEDDRTLDVQLGKLDAGRVYRLTVAESVRNADGESLRFRDVYYTANRVPGP